MAGVVPPRAGEGAWVCLKCGKHFRTSGGDGKSLIKMILGPLTVPKCPKCGSHNVHKDMAVVW